jgi:serine/threonine protein kinase
MATQAVQGVNFLHGSSPQIIHGDLKSHNILLDDKWNVKISDFGLTQYVSQKYEKKLTVLLDLFLERSVTKRKPQKVTLARCFGVPLKYSLDLDILQRAIVRTSPSL